MRAVVVLSLLISSIALADVDDVGTAGVIDEGELFEALSTLMLLGDEPARVAVIVDDSDERRRTAVERSLVRVLRDRRREDIVTPALVRARLGENARLQLTQTGGGAGLAADHILFADVQTGGSARLSLRLLKSETGEVRGTAQVNVQTPSDATTARPLDVKIAATDLADLIAEAVERRGLEPRTTRLGVLPANAQGAARDAKLDKLTQSELVTALRSRGFLIVERARLQAAMDEAALAQLEESGAVALGQQLGADALILSSVVEAADTFIVTTRTVGVESGDVLGAARATLKREGTVAYAAVELRTPGDAAVYSAIAPGWGQAHNGHGTKALLFGVTTYGALATTAGLGIASGASYVAYNSVTKSETVTAEQASQQAVALRQQTNGFITATAIAGGVTAAIWALNIADAFLTAPAPY